MRCPPRPFPAASQPANQHLQHPSNFLVDVYAHATAPHPPSRLPIIAFAPSNCRTHTPSALSVTRRAHVYPRYTLSLSTMLPLTLLTTVQGHPLLVELKNGETLNGHLVSCDTWMNLTLKEVIQTSPDGDTFHRLPEAYVRGNNIKYLRVPDEIIDIVKEQQAAAAASGDHHRGGNTGDRGSGNRMRGGGDRGDRGGRGEHSRGDRGRGGHGGGRGEFRGGRGGPTRGGRGRGM
ncbi:hypothetical protein Dda_7145 [Drechslerella dactyloides]|uniref:LSM complex subunit LSM4 n=1 Tax=Drechslerella dactyloides TaxID=74499 RepID=A0AAD6IWX5_DREDA|nr:hypothetical protein Dda_7145 [Drechslerella dactyloides]